ncbi:hypothetical protein THRCLA_07582 [Thraustotheca clavata]|uniref:protein-serine/threonine phosphatase n=1 Tax=Thraustotheca clavata TaxID=74557 RepID=A0A1V9ZCN6_9STRA|nr:hypothetical protein THRCLA_07582 [Thraustotheca clavata]
MSSEVITLVGKWKKEEVRVEAIPEMRILDVKQLLYERVGIHPTRQKLIGLNLRGKPAADDVLLSALTLKNPQKFMLVGTIESEVFVDLPPSARPNVFDDFTCAFAPDSALWHIAKENNLALQKAIEEAQIPIIHQPRQGKKLLVLDLDHTLMDISATKDNDIPSSRFMRPHLHIFLTRVWAQYDLCIWSQTSWKWIEIKLTELGMLTTPDYRINFIMDKTNMFVYNAPDARKKRSNKVKALEIIWKKFPGLWHMGNTVHVDDLPHNFNMNPRNGIPIQRYDCKETVASQDTQLLLLADYLIDTVASLDDVTRVDHTNWNASLH